MPLTRSSRLSCSATYSISREFRSARRLIGMVFDLGIFSYGMHVGGETFALLYPIYLWVIFGNGFRFGVPYLFAATATSVMTFGIVIATTPFWQEHRGLAAGLIAGLILLPLYVSTLIRKLSEAKRQAEEANRAKERVPRQHQPRIPHAAQRHHRAERSRRQHQARLRAGGNVGNDRQVGPPAAGADQLDPRFFPRRSRPDLDQGRRFRSRLHARRNPEHPCAGSAAQRRAACDSLHGPHAAAFGRRQTSSRGSSHESRRQRREIHRSRLRRDRGRRGRARWRQCAIAV